MKLKKVSFQKPKVNMLRFGGVLLLLLISATTWAQKKPKMTKVSGIVIDAETKEPLPFVNVAFVGTSVGMTTDFDGKFDLSSLWASDSLQASFIGFIPQTKFVKKGTRQQVNFELSTTALNLNTVEVKAKKRRYRKKNNPAVDLIRNVIKNKNQNRLKGQDFYAYDKYEKIEVDINNITDKFRNKKIFKKFQFIFDYVDTSEINGKPYLPMYIRETAARTYYRKKPKAEKEFRSGIKITDFDKYLNEEAVSTLLDILYQDIDIYNNHIFLLANQFVSPVAPLAPDFYKYYIIDTVELEDGKRYIDLAFLPRNQADFGFKGDLYISVDSNYTIKKLDMGVSKKINLNFVRDIKIEQEFDQLDGIWVITKDKITIDYSLSNKGLGFFGNRTVLYDKFDFTESEDPDVYSDGADRIVEASDAYDKDPQFWADARQEPLSENEQGVYDMIDTLQSVPAFRNTLEILRLILSGYKSVGPVDIGPVNAFYSFNDVEGFRLRFGGQTNFDFSKKLLVEGYGAYGFKDKEFKYYLGATYSFNEDHLTNPRHFIRATYQHETSFPGQRLQFVNEDNFFLSFRRGVTDRMLFSDSYKLEYKNEKPAVEYHFLFEHKERRPYGNLSFPVVREESTSFLQNVTTTELGVSLRYAPNETYLQGMSYRFPVYNRYPIFNLHYRAGLKNVLGGKYNYHRVETSIFKRFYLSILGYTDVEVEAGKIFGDEIPYILLHLPQANQTYAYQLKSYNMMNFMEFISDEFVSLNATHFFNGFFFNKIPLFKKLKFREVISLKMLYGRLTDPNNPELNSALVQLPTNEDGTPATFLFGDEPYIEASIGVSNIFKVVRLDLVKRMTYLDNPNIPQLWGVKGLGVRVRFKFEF